MREPLVSVVIPNRDRTEQLTDAVLSVQAQSHRQWEVVIVDDHSQTDVERMLAERFASDPRVRLVQQSDSKRGAPAARNLGLVRCRGDYVLFLDSDDQLKATCLEHRLTAAKANPDADFVVGATAVFHNKPGDSPALWNRFNHENDLDRFLRADTPWQTAGPLWRRQSLDRLGFWDEDAFDWQDWEYHTRALAAGFRYRKLDLVDSYWRSPRPDSISAAAPKLDAKREKSRIRLIGKIRRCLNENGLLSQSRTRVLMSLAAWFTRRALWQQDIKAAEQIRSTSLEERIIPGSRRFAEGVLWRLIDRRPELLRRLAVRLWCSLMIVDQTVLASSTRWSESQSSSPSEPA